MKLKVSVSMTEMLLKSRLMPVSKGKWRIWSGTRVISGLDDNSSWADDETFHRPTATDSNNQQNEELRHIFLYTENTFTSVLFYKKGTNKAVALT